MKHHILQQHPPHLSCILWSAIQTKTHWLLSKNVHQTRSNWDCIYCLYFFCFIFPVCRSILSSTVSHPLVKSERYYGSAIILSFCKAFEIISWSEHWGTNELTLEALFHHTTVIEVCCCTWFPPAVLLDLQAISLEWLFEISLVR